MSLEERKVAERILMGELKELQKENWVEAEVRLEQFRLIRPDNKPDVYRRREMGIYSFGTSLW